MNCKIVRYNKNIILDENLNNSFIAGNKVRKVKAIINSNESVSGILSFGSPFSSHILACAWWARKMNIPFKAIILVEDKINSEYYPNLKMAKKFGADLVFTLNKDAYSTIEYLREKLSHYLWIPGGAHTVEASNAYESLFDILFEQEESMDEIKSIILPYGTGTTAYGIWKSARKNNPKIEVIGISVSREKEKCFESLYDLDQITKFPGLTVIDQFSGKYGKIDAKSEKYRWKFFDNTGILLDPIYNTRSAQYFYENNLENSLLVNTGGMLNNLL